MIVNLDIKNFGSFKDFVWRKSVGSNVDFKRLNIIYGRNYSGKTTLSRIFRSIQEKSFPENYENPNFTLTTDTGILNAQKALKSNLDIRVYNKDFIKTNLSFLEDHTEGDIKTFAIIGGDNQKLEEQIKEKEIKLGSIDNETGLRNKLSLKQAECTKANLASTSQSNSINDKLKKHANNVIKKNRDYNDVNYNINKIKADVGYIRENNTSILPDEEALQLLSLIKEKSLSEIIEKTLYEPVASDFHEKSNELISKEIKPTTPIQDLLNDALLQNWVKSGIEQHKGKRDSCGFCGQKIPNDLWKKLDEHFSKESEELDARLNDLIAVIRPEIEQLKTILELSREQFYTSEKSKFDLLKKVFSSALTDYKKQLLATLKLLEKRKTNIFKTFPMTTISNDGTALSVSIKSLSDLVKQNNLKTKTLSDDKDNARDKLRINDVARFIRDIDLGAEEKKNKKLEETASNLNEEKNIISDDIVKIEKLVESLKTQQNDEKKGAERVNEYLNHFFGHGSLHLNATEDKDQSNFKFQIMRGDKKAYNLSEGECSLISFCYFIAKLEDTDTKGKDLIVYIDDPISSLDSNHIFFVYSLIESILAKPDKNTDGSNNYRYKQLFISTHNLDFLKYVKRLSIPRKKIEVNGKKKNVLDDAYFIIEMTDASNMRPMPNYLKDYTTEFNYLFHQIFLCQDAINAEDNHERFYSFGNNLRKFLEAFLFYKYPCHDDKNDKLERLNKFFGNDTAAIALTNRLSNELSHLEEIFDRSMKPIEIPEIPSLASFVLDKIFEKDPDQYNALLKSIGQPERTA